MSEETLTGTQVRNWAQLIRNFVLGDSLYINTAHNDVCNFIANELEDSKTLTLAKIEAEVISNYPNSPEDVEVIMYDVRGQFKKALALPQDAKITDTSGLLLKFDTDFTQEISKGSKTLKDYPHSEYSFIVNRRDALYSIEITPEIREAVAKKHADNGDILEILDSKDIGEMCSKVNRIKDPITKALAEGVVKYDIGDALGLSVSDQLIALRQTELTLKMR